MICKTNMIKKDLSKKLILSVLGIITLFLFTRIFNLGKLPIFADEAIYVRWAQIMRAEPSLRFLPLQDGKQPLFMWAVIPLLKLFKDPLIAGRMLSVFSGLFSLLGVLFLGRLLNFKNNEIILVGLIYVWLPFAGFFERMALVDSLLAGFTIWSFILSLLLAKTQRLDVSMLLGFVLGGALLTKSPGKIFVGLAILTLVWQSIFDFSLKKIIKRFGLFGVSLVIAFMMYNILRLGPNFHMIGLRNQDYIWSFSDLKKQPFVSLWSNLGHSLRYYRDYLTWPFFVLSILGLGEVVLEKFKQRKFGRLDLLMWMFLPLLGIAAIGKTFTARYILFTIPFAVIFMVYGLRLIKKLFPQKIYFIVLASAFMPAFLFTYFLWNNPVKANLPKDEHSGYLQDWTAGWGIKEISQYLKARPKDNQILVGTEGYFGTLPDGLQIYVQDEPNINVIGVGLPISEIPKELLEAKAAGNEVYLVVNQSRFKLNNWEEKGLNMINKYSKPGSDKLLFFRLE